MGKIKNTEEERMFDFDSVGIEISKTQEEILEALKRKNEKAYEKCLGGSMQRVLMAEDSKGNTYADRLSAKCVSDMLESKVTPADLEHLGKVVGENKDGEVKVVVNLSEKVKEICDSEEF